MAKKDPGPQEEIEHGGKEKEKEKGKEKEGGKEGGKGEDKKGQFTEVKNASASGMGSMGKEVEE